MQRQALGQLTLPPMWSPEVCRQEGTWGLSRLKGSPVIIVMLWLHGHGAEATGKAAVRTVFQGM